MLNAENGTNTPNQFLIQCSSFIVRWSVFGLSSWHTMFLFFLSGYWISAQCYIITFFYILTYIFICVLRSLPACLHSPFNQTWKSLKIYRTTSFSRCEFKTQLPNDWKNERTKKREKATATLTKTTETNIPLHTMCCAVCTICSQATIEIRFVLG